MGPPVERAVEVLVRGGCDGVTVVVGAAAGEVAAVLGKISHKVDIVRCDGWSEGMGTSLRAGLTALTARSEVEAVLISLVDLPDVGPAVVRRVPGGTPRGPGIGAEPSGIRRCRRPSHPHRPGPLGRCHRGRTG